MNVVVAILQLPPILSHQTRRLPNRPINKTEFQRLRGETNQRLEPTKCSPRKPSRDPQLTASRGKPAIQAW
jgi:hypothetical protein